jgi:serine protease Do/serine protease DegQ
LGVVIASPSFAALPGSVPTLAPMLERVTPAVVNIATRGKVVVQQRGLFDSPLFNDPFFQRYFDYPQRQRERETRSLGSGVIVDAQRGYLLTNHHVIESAQTITVTLTDGRELDGELIGSDPKSDIAVVKIPARQLTALSMGDSAELRVGDFVVAIGNPFGLGQTVTSGIVSALGRSGLGIEDFEDFIQTDASINPGNSGGALVSLDGRLVGINTAILGPNGGNIGIGFAIPSNMAMQIMEQLVAHGEVRRGRLGVSVQEMTPELARAFDLDSQSGVVISRVEALELNGRRIRDSDAMRNAIGLLRVGQKITVRFIRDGEERTLEATIEETASVQAEGGDYSRHLRGALLSQQFFSNGRPVIHIDDVQANSEAWQAGLRAGDLILSANRRDIHDLDELRAAINLSDDLLLLNIQRGNSALFVLLQ